MPTANNSFHTISSPDHERPNMCSNDEYQGLFANINFQNDMQRKNSGKTYPVRKESDGLDSVDSEFNNSFHAGNRPKKSDDFKSKFKTEMCKFWQIDGTCKFKESV